MTLVALTGIPGTGKSTICNILRGKNFRCYEALQIFGSNECMEGEEVDIDCLSSLWAHRDEKDVIVASHYSHLLGADFVIILERDPELVEKSLLARGYSSEKIFENMDSLYSDIIYQESLDLLPSTRIYRIMNKEGKPAETAEAIMKVALNIFSGNASKL